VKNIPVKTCQTGKILSTLTFFLDIVSIYKRPSFSKFLELQIKYFPKDCWCSSDTFREAEIDYIWIDFLQHTVMKPTEQTYFWDF